MKTVLVTTKKHKLDSNLGVNAHVYKYDSSVVKIKNFTDINKMFEDVISVQILE